MKLFTTLLLFISTASFSQDKLDFGSIKADKNFCSKATNSYFDSSYGLSKICNSSNQLEIRLFIVGLPIYNAELISVTYDTLTGWQAFKYKDNFSDTWYDTTLNRKATKLKLKPTSDFETFFDALKDNDIFKLPDQKDLKYDDFVLDGTNYTVTFKAGDNIRSYTFWNPEILIKRNRKVKEFRKYIRIAKLFYNSLTTE